MTSKQTSHFVIRILVNNDREVEKNPVWHLLDRHVDDHPLCSGEFVVAGEGLAEAEIKEVKRGGITCPDCLEMIREIKAVRL